jgi:hypothetical protein
VASYLAFPPGKDCDLLIACNGGPLPTALSLIFSPLNPKFFLRENDPSWDVGAYLDAARGPCKGYDAMLCLGESIHFVKEGWLTRLVEAWQHCGSGFYGVFSSNAVSPHLQTSAFMCAPSTLLLYPTKPKTRVERYDFEYGRGALWRRVVARGMPVRLVTWDGEWEPFRWRMPRNILWRGTQENLLCINNHAEGYANANRKTQSEWARRCDGPFR